MGTKICMGSTHALIDKLDIIFYPEPGDVQLVDDGERSTCEKFRNDIIKMYDTYLEHNSRVRDKLTRLSGTVEQRMVQIKQTLNNYDKIR